jgi:hypothetical protein
MKLFDGRGDGIFRGFSGGGLEFHADLVLPYKSEFQNAPMHGQFVLVQLESDQEAVLGRITAISSEGRLSTGSGEDYGLRALAEERPVPEDLREQYLKYRVDIRVLGVVRLMADNVHFAPSHRRLPHVGSAVAFPNDDLLRQLAAHNAEGAEVGYLAFGEFVFAGDDKRLSAPEWVIRKKPMIAPRFNVSQLVSRRSFVFARAGFGKSNLVKLLFSSLYETTPTITKRRGVKKPVGTVLFDPDGEYFWPDESNRPGLADIPHLKDQLVVFTNREAPSPFYGSFVVGGIKLDIRRLRPSDVVSIALPPDRQDQQNVRKLRSLNTTDWSRLVDLIYRYRNSADPQTVAQLLGLTLPGQEAEMLAARANMTHIVQMLHDPSSQVMDMLLHALRQGKLCVVDVSQMRGTRALILSGLILQRIFDNNQEEFTKASPNTIPTIAVVEEAQSMLGAAHIASEGPYVTWVKEGRKYDLGAVLITQQPASISDQLLSQGDNWFIFHLLSSGDLRAVKNANAHFSDDLLSSLLNEPIEGHGVFWSSAGATKYPLSVRALLFESLYEIADPEYKRPAVQAFAGALRKQFAEALEKTRSDAAEASDTEVVASAEDEIATKGAADVDTGSEGAEDVLKAQQQAAIAKVKRAGQVEQRVRKGGMPWRGVQQAIADELPETMVDRDEIAYKLVPPTLDFVFGKAKWTTERRDSKSRPGATTLYVIVVT